MRARRFTDYGLGQFEQYIRRLKQEPMLTPPTDLLEASQATELVMPEVAVEQRSFPTKFDAGVYLCDKLSGVPVDQLRRDVGLWAWLTLFYFDAVCPPDGHGRRRPKDLPNYISRALGGADGLVKHLLFFPWRMVQQHGDRADFILSAKLLVDAKIAREWGTRLYEALMPAKVELGREMYWDDDAKTVRRGATSTGSRTRPGRRGNVRRFLGILNQLELTYDLSALDADGLAQLLPSNEFEPWLRHRDNQVS